MLGRRIKILRPLSVRDFALLWTGMTVSLIGDGIYLVALAWQVYDLSNVPTALSLVGVAWTLPMVIFLLLGGVISDRFERRKVMIVSDLVRCAAISVLGLLSVGEVLELWHVVAIVAVYGSADALFNPAFGAIVPDIVPAELLVEANSLDQFVRPLTWRLVGPAIGGFLIHTMGGAGGAFLVDGATFAVSAVCLAAMTARYVPAERPERPSAIAEIREGFGFVRAHVWLWATLSAAGLSLLFHYGPLEVLLPFVVRNRLDGEASDLGLVLAAGGLGAILAAFVIAQRGLPRRHILFMYLMWMVAIGSIAGYAVVESVWLASAINFVTEAADAAGLVVWGTLMHRLVPAHLLGRVSSVDWIISIGLVPLSFGLTGPIAAAVGTGPTLVGAAILGMISTALFMFVPGLYDTEQQQALVVAEPPRASA